MKSLTRFTKRPNKNIDPLIPYLVQITALVYFLLLSAKQYTWMFVSEDAADWLASANWWMVPQPLGSPLYVILGKGINLFSSNLVFDMTFLLSCWPAAVTVALVYCIVLRLKGSKLHGLVAATILTASVIFLSQSTVLEEYALAVMLLTAAYLFYLKGQRKTTWLMLGLSTAVHSIVLPVVAIWFLADWQARRENLKALPIYIVAGILPYAYVLVLMSMDTPRFMAGGLNWASIRDYLMGASGHVTGTLSTFDFPRRLLEFGTVSLACLGLAAYPLYRGLKSQFQGKWVLLSVSVIALWFYLTCFYKTAWVFLIFLMPAAAIIIGIGLSKIRTGHIKILICSVGCLLIANTFLYNANTLTNAEPIAQTLYNSIWQVPDGSVIVGTPRYTTTAIYCMSEGKDIIPLTSSYIDGDPKFENYLDYLHDRWGLRGNDSFEIIESAWRQGRAAYYAGVGMDDLNKEASRCFELYDTGLVSEITGFTGLPSPFAVQPGGSQEK